MYVCMCGCVYVEHNIGTNYNCSQPVMARDREIEREIEREREDPARLVYSQLLRCVASLMTQLLPSSS